MRPGHHLLARMPAKFSPPSLPAEAYHPLYCHMHDVAAVAGKMWDEVLAGRGRAFVASHLGLDEAAARRWVTLLAGLHDLGKAAPAFHRHMPGHPAVLGLPGDLPPSPSDVVPKHAPHGVVTALALDELLRHLGVRRDLAKRMGTTAGGHHGFFPSSEDLEDVAARLPATGGLDPVTQRKPWHEAREMLFHAFAEDLGCGEVPVPTRFDNAVAIFLAGLISVADWIGSDDTIFEFLSKDGREPSARELEGYRARAEERAGKALQRLGWAWRPPEVPAEFVDVFKFEPRGVQVEAIDLAPRLAGPSITVIEAPTGEGKSEAALFLAHAMAKAGVRGFYLALPTQATSNQLYTRVRNILSAQYRDSAGPVLLQLLHGHASLSAEFEADLRHDTGEDFSLVAPRSVYDDDGTSTGRTMALDWFTHRKRGPLAPFGVGTIDQALLSILQTRHVFVRLFGFAGKTIIVDEVHAYDTYMSTLLERLLEWMAALGSPVVLLSATLPAKRTHALIEAYARGAGVPGVSGRLAEYPRITWWAGGTELQSIPTTPSDVGSRTLAWEWLGGMGEGDEASLARWLAEQVTEGGCAVVICNTVGRAQKVYRAVRVHLETLPDGERPELVLFHARFPFEVRDEREKQVLLNFGKRGARVTFPDGEEREVQRPTRAILVATQVVEQSLDLDFDLMVTDLAPVDLLLQRAGRLHRHLRDDRPPRLAAPVLHIVAPGMVDGVPQFPGGDAKVYSEHVLLRTWLSLDERVGKPIAIPADVEGLIEAVYGDAACPGDASAVLRAKWDETAAALEKERVADEVNAKDRVISNVSSVRELARLVSTPLDEDNPDLHAVHQALTRLAEPSVQVVCLEEGAAGPTLPGGEPVDLSAKPDRALAERLLRRSVTLSDKRIVFALREQPPPAGWSRSALLRHHRVLLFRDGTVPVGEWMVVLDDEVGVLVERSHPE